MHLTNPKFRLADWYAQQVGELRGLDPALVRRWRQKVLDTRPLTMETPLATRVEQLLTAWGRFPLDPPERARKNHFECLRDTDGLYWVRDHLLVYITKIPVDLLVNEQFEVAKWYEQRLQRAHDQLCQRLRANEQEYNTCRLLDRGRLSPEECQLEEVVRCRDSILSSLTMAHIAM
jgi:hypothetical protein